MSAWSALIRPANTAGNIEFTALAHNQSPAPSTASVTAECATDDVGGSVGVTSGHMAQIDTSAMRMRTVCSPKRTAGDGPASDSASHPPHKAAHRMAHRREEMSRADGPVWGDVTVTAKVWP